MSNKTYSKSEQSMTDRHETIQSKGSTSNILSDVIEIMVNRIDQIERVIPKMLKNIDNLVSDNNVTAV